MKSLSKAKLKLFTSLQHKKYRYQHRMLVVEGKKMFQEAYQSTWQIEAVIVRKDLLAKDLAYIPPTLTDRLWAAEPQDFRQLTTQVQSEGIFTVLHFPDDDFGLSQPNLPPTFEGAAFILDQIQDPGNAGTMIRTLDWLGIPNVICTHGTVDVLNPKCLRASMGSVFRLKIHYIKSVENILPQAPQNVWIADMNGQSLNDISLGKDDWILLGNEANGISPALRELSGINFVSIAGKGDAESLNVSAAAAIIAWELSKLQG